MRSSTSWTSGWASSAPRPSTGPTAPASTCPASAIGLARSAPPWWWTPASPSAPCRSRSTPPAPTSSWPSATSGCSARWAAATCGSRPTCGTDGRSRRTGSSGPAPTTSPPWPTTRTSTCPAPAASTRASARCPRSRRWRSPPSSRSSPGGPSASPPPWRRSPARWSAAWPSGASTRPCPPPSAARTSSGSRCRTPPGRACWAPWRRTAASPRSAGGACASPRTSTSRRTTSTAWWRRSTSPCATRRRAPRLERRDDLGELVAVALVGEVAAALPQDHLGAPAVLGERVRDQLEGLTQLALVGDRHDQPLGLDDLDEAAQPGDLGAFVGHGAAPLAAGPQVPLVDLEVGVGAEPAGEEVGLGDRPPHERPRGLVSAGDRVATLGIVGGGCVGHRLALLGVLGGGRPFTGPGVDWLTLAPLTCIVNP